jgi:hypothetical protein
MKSPGFETLYASVPTRKNGSTERRPFTRCAVTARQMYEHTRGVNPYYFGEIGLHADQDGTIAACRKRAFEKLETRTGFLDNRIFDGSFHEQWTLRKVLRRFVWHDRIHAKALYRAARNAFGDERIPDVFYFQGLAAYAAPLPIRPMRVVQSAWALFLVRRAMGESPGLVAIGGNA